MEADGFATAFMAMGSEKVKSVNSKLGLPVMLVLSDSTTWTSPIQKHDTEEIIKTNC